jgi:hypothetical protein
VRRVGTVEIVAALVIGSLVGFWAFVTQEAMYVAVGLPMTALGAAMYRIERLGQLVEELRAAQRIESR